MFFVARILLPAVALGFLAGQALALPQDDRTVQTLANFPALQHLAAASDRAVRAYVRAASAAYIRAGYDDFGPALRRSGAGLIGQFDGRDVSLRRFRAALGTLDRALARDRFLVLPQKIGGSRADFHGVAATFLDHARTALKNLSKGKNIANTLRKFDGGLFITQTDADIYSTTSGTTFTTNASGTFDLSANILLAGGSTYTGAYTITNGNTLLAGGSLTFTPTQFTLDKVYVLPAGAPLPIDVDYFILRELQTAETLGGVDLPASARLLFFPSGATVPESAQALPLGSSVTFTLGGNAKASGLGSLTFGTNFSSSATLGMLTLVGTAVTFQQNTASQWIAFAPGATLPDAQAGATLLLGRDYQTDATLLPSGTRIGLLGIGAALPDGATALPTAAFTITPVP